MTERPFLNVLGDTPELRVAQQLLALRFQKLNQKEIAAACGLTRQTAARVLTKFSDWGLVTMEKEGNQYVVTLCDSSALAYSLDAVNGAVLEKLTGVEVLERKPVLEISKVKGFTRHGSAGETLREPIRVAAA